MRTQQKQQEVNTDEVKRKHREGLFNNVSFLIWQHIKEAERLINEPTEAAMLFHESNFIGSQWDIYNATGYSSTMPLFYFHFQEVPFEVKACDVKDVVELMREVINGMGLATETIVISLIYLEMLMKCTKIEIRYINWKPLLFTSILLASKFWEDINFWNVDYEDHLNLYDLKAINRMES